MNAIVGMIPYILICVLIGYFGKEKKLGFWGNFLISLLLSPLVGLIVLWVQHRPAKAAEPAGA